MLGKNDEKLISVREAAKECGRNMETVRRWIWAGKLPAEKLGNQLFIKKSDLVNYCRETAVIYDAGPSTFNLEKAKELRGKTGVRGVEPVDSAEEIRKMRGEGLSDIESILRGNTNMEYEAKVERKEDFIERAIRFRAKLKARGYPEVDTAAMVKKSREGRMGELRQSLR